MSEIRTTIQIQVSPSASREELIVAEDGAIRARVKAPAHEGKANAALMFLLAKRLGVPRSTINMVRGRASRQKMVAVEGLSREEVIRRLTVALVGK